MELLFILVLVLWGLYKFVALFFQSDQLIDENSTLIYDYWNESENLKQRLGLHSVDDTLSGNSLFSAQIEAAAIALASAREKLAVDYGKRALGANSIKSGHQAEFKRQWLEVCNVVEAKYGGDIAFEALHQLKLTKWR